MRTRARLAALCLPLATLLCADAQPPEKPSAEEVRREIARLGADDLDAREAAFARLLALGILDPEGVVALLPEEDPDPEVAARALALRERIPWAARRARALEAARKQPEATRSAIAAFFDDPSQGNLNLLLLSNPSGEVVSGILEGFLEHKDRAVRQRAVETLFRYGSPRHFVRIARMLDDPAQEVRWAAATAVAGRPEPEVDQSAEGFLRHPDAGVRQAAVRVAGGSRRPDLLAKLHDLLGDEDAGVRVQVINAVSHVGDRSILHKLVPLLGDPHEQVVAAAAQMLGDHREASAAKPLASLLEHASVGVRFTALQALEKIGAKEAAPQVAACLRDPEPGIRSFALGWLGKHGGKEHAAAVAELLEDPDLSVQANAIAVLGKRVGRDFGRGPGAVDAACDWWDKHKSDPEYAPRK